MRQLSGGIKFSFWITRATVGDMAVQAAPMALLSRAVPVAVVGYRAFLAHGQRALGLGMVAVAERA